MSDHRERQHMQSRAMEQTKQEGGTQAGTSVPEAVGRDLAQQRKDILNALLLGGQRAVPLALEHGLAAVLRPAAATTPERKKEGGGTQQTNGSSLHNKQHKHTHTCIRTHLRTDARTHTRKHTHARTHAHAHTHTHTHTHTHAHTYVSDGVLGRTV